MLFGLALFGVVCARPQFSSIGEGAYGPGEKINLFGHFPEEADSREGNYNAYLFHLETAMGMSNRIALQCESKTTDTFENGDPLPLTQQMYFKTFLSCDLPEMQLRDGQTYGFIYEYENEDGKIVEDAYPEISFLFDESIPIRNGKPLHKLAFEQAIENGLVGDRERSGKPKITGITPRHASPYGGVLVTISGNNLRSNQLDLGAGNRDETPGEGENVQIYFERSGVKVPCDVDRMNMLHAESMKGLDYLVCVTRPFPTHTHYWVRVVIDDYKMNGDHIYFHPNHAPTVDKFYPQGSAPAKPIRSFDLANTFWTEWYDLDQDEDEVEDESLLHHMLHDPATFQKCQNPIDIYVEDKTTGLQFVASTEQNADGFAEPAYNSVLQGFKCENDAQTIDPQTEEPLATCVDVRVKYECMSSVVESKGRIFTDVHGRSENKDFFVNRLMEYPKVINHGDNMKGECQVHVNDGTPEECGDHANCGRNRKLQFKKIDGNNGIIQFQPAMAIPGSYNFTFQTYKNGNSNVNRKLKHLMGNEDYFSSDFEIYPQILSVSPHAGATAGGTLLTIKGTGFLEDGLGGTVSVMVGDDECKVESMTETEIKCRTIGGPASAEPFGTSRVFTSHNDHVTKSANVLNKPCTSGDDCEAACRKDAACVAFSYFEGKCRLQDDIGGDDDENVGAGNWEEAPGAIAGYLKFSERPDETDCYSGRGEKYVGNADVAESGKACLEGTMCRHAPGKKRPVCNTDEEKVEYCNIAKCDEKFGKFVGNRGADLEILRRDLKNEIYSVNWHPSEINANDRFKVLTASYSPGKREGFFGFGDKLNYYSAKMKMYFIAPYSGVFRLIGRSDNVMQLTSDYNSETGQFKKLFTITHYCKESDSFCSSGPGYSEPITLTKGELVQLQSISSEGRGGDHRSIGAQHFGPDGTGTWIDTVKKSSFPYRDNYIYGKQQIYAYKDIDDTYTVQDFIWITLRYDPDFYATTKDLQKEDPPLWDDDKKGAFRIKMCGSDEGKENTKNCFTTKNIDLKKADADEIEDELRTFLVTECTVKDKNVQFDAYYHGQYETGEDWPGRGHFERGQGAWCGRKAHEVHNHEIFNEKIKKKFTTKVAPHICFAYRGRIDRIEYAASFNYSDDNGKLQKFRAWFKVAVNLNAEKWDWKCYNQETILDDMENEDGSEKAESREGPYFDITNIKLTNSDDIPIYLDELHIGTIVDGNGRTINNKDYGFDRSTPLTYDGQVPKEIDVWKQNHAYGAHFRIHINNWDHRTDCGGYVPLPDILGPDSSPIHIGTEDEMTYKKLKNPKNYSGKNWRTWDKRIGYDYDGLYPGWLAWALGRSEPAGYTDYKFTEIDTQYDMDDKHYINKLDVVVTRQGMADEGVESDVILRYGNSPDVLKVRMDKHLHNNKMRELLVETWPELGDLAIKAYRHGWCNQGWRFDVSSNEHGPFHDFSIEIDPHGQQNERNRGLFYRVDRAGYSSAYTHVLPGSVIATAHHVPQVVVIANGQRSACDNCDFLYRDDMQPSIVSVIEVSSGEWRSQIPQIGSDIQLQVTYKLHNDDFTGFSLSLGGFPCTVSDRTTESAVCTLSQIPEGDYDLVLENQFGASTWSDQITIMLTVTDGVPRFGSVYGGTQLFYTGFGFKSGTIYDDAFVGFTRRFHCQAEGEVTFTTMTCRTDVTPNEYITDQVDTSKSPQMTSAEMTFENDHATVTIEGANLKNTGCTSKFHYGDIVFEEGDERITEWTAVKIVLSAPNHTPGTLPVYVDVCMNSDDLHELATAEDRDIHGGYSNRKDITVNDVSITQVASRDKSHSESSFSSIMGGLELSIKGSNLATGSYNSQSTDGLEVLIGEIPCDVKSAEHVVGGKDEIICITRPHKQRVSLVLNGGVWVNEETLEDASDFTIEQGTEVSWRWNIQLEGIEPKVQFKKGRSEWSEELGGVGTFSKFFDGTGKHDYTTGAIDGQELEITATLRVEKATDKPYKLKVTSGGYEALHKGGNSKKQPKNCDIVPGRTTNEGESGDGFYVIYSWLVTHTVTEWKFSSTPVNSRDWETGVIEKEDNSIVGKITARFSKSDMNSCKKQFTILIGDIDCYKICKENNQKNCEDSGNGLRYCQLEDLYLAGVEFVPGKRYALKALGTSMGYAYDESEINSVAFVPHIQKALVSGSDDKKEFSFFGGVDLEFNGAGFVQGDEIILKSEAGEQEMEHICHIQELTYKKVKCRLNRFSTYHRDIDDKIKMTAYSRLANDFRMIQLTDDEHFRAQEEYTPIVEILSESDGIDLNEVVMIQGKFISEVIVTFGNTGLSCLRWNWMGESETSRSYFAECTVPELTAGIYPLTFTTRAGGTNDFSRGAVMTEEAFSYTKQFVVDNIAAQGGWRNGGKLVEITGTAFNDDIIVTVRDKNNHQTLCDYCPMTVKSSELIVFEMPHLMESAEVVVIVKHEVVSASYTEFVTFSDAPVPVWTVNEDIASSAGIADNVPTIGVEGDLGGCDKINLEIGFLGDPCAAGAHQCPGLADCVPTDDNLSYTCTCPGNDAWDGDKYGPYGSGFDCLEWAFHSRVENEEEAAVRCGEQWDYAWSLVEFDTTSHSHLPAVKTIMMSSYRLFERYDFDYLYFKMDGKVRCGMVKDCTDPAACADLEGGATADPIKGFLIGDRGLLLAPEGECGTDFTHGYKGKEYEKHGLCTRYKHKNCYDDSKNGDNGRHTYESLRTTALDGKPCLDWKRTKWYTDETSRYDPYRKIIDNLLVPNQCINLWNSDDGVECVTEFQLDGDHTTQSCGIPSCQSIQNGPIRSECTIQTAAPINNEEIWEDEDGYDGENLGCFLGGIVSKNSPKNTEYSFQNLRRCYHRSRWSHAWTLEPVDISKNSYRIKRKRRNYLGYIVVDVGEKQDQQVRFEVLKEDELGRASIINVEPVDGLKNTFTLRVGAYFMIALDVSETHWMRVVHESNLHLHQPEQVQFVIKCTSDDYGSLIPRPAPSFERIATVAPTDVCNQEQKYLFKLPDLNAGSYSAIVRSEEGFATGLVEFDVDLIVNRITPNPIGLGGNVQIKVFGSGFSDDTKAFVCGKELIFKSLTRSTVPGEDSVMEFESVPYTKEECDENEFMLTSLSASSGEEIAYPPLRSRNRRQVVLAGGTEADNLNPSDALTPIVSNVTPEKGGTAGGTQVTITGTNFGTDLSVVTVTIFDVECTPSSVTETQIVCETGIFVRTDPDGQLITQEPVRPVVTIKDDHGRAKYDEDGEITFWYIDRWSSPYTWGCTDDSCLPQQGEIIVIPKGQIILLDITTPVLAVLLLDGGRLIWDRKDGIELHMQYGIVNAGGSFEIGTEEEPFCPHKALIKLYGHQRSINLPIYGAKVLAVRFGTFDMHGCRKTTTWTEMAVTGEAGDKDIYLTHPVHDDWHPGNEIIIAATGDVTNFHRSEKMVIESVSETPTNKGYKVTLKEALKHRHIAVCSNGPGDNGSGWGWAGEICTRAEVGLLSRNIKMMGNFNEDWAETFKECELGIGTAFGVQTCFQNRFGHETGSDQFGSVLFLHKVTHARIEFAEFTHAGQAFNLARYPIHFHVPGSLPDSYVRGCGIHNTFNRALTMHGVHDLLVEFNVIYNVMGLAFFLEDAIEENNTLRYNLGIMNKKSSSLLNVDSTPAVFWIPNPNNIFYGNRAAGSSHFGYWFNPPDHPTGPSARDPEHAGKCVKNRPLGTFYNNTAHSMGKYGLWIFTDLTPTGPDGVCGETTPRAMKFGHVPDKNENGVISKDTFGFFAWHCERGAEIATGGALQFHNMIVANNWIAGLAGKETFLNTFADEGAEDQSQLFKRNIVIGHLDGDPELEACGDMGIETPWKEFSFTVDDIHFFNYDIPTPDKASVDLNTFPMRGELSKRRCVAIDPCYGTNAFDCGAVTRYSNVKWHKADRKTTFAWEHEAALYDKDGTLLNMGEGGYYVIAKSPAYDTTVCSDETSGRYDIAGTTFNSKHRSHPAMICKETGKDGKHFKPHRFMFNNASPSSMEGTVVSFENEFGEAKSPFRNCRPRGKGWMVLLDGNQEYKMTFTQHDHVSNISYTGDIDDFEQNEWLTIKHDLPEKIDYAKVGTESNQMENHVDPWPTNPFDLNTYDYTYVAIAAPNEPHTVRYTFNGKEAATNPANDGYAMTLGLDFNIKPDFYKCFYTDCKTPEPEGLVKQPALEECNYNDCFGDDGAPMDWQILTVGESQHMILDKAALQAKNHHLKFTRMMVDGTLEIPRESLEAGDHLIIEADSLIVNTGAVNNQAKLSLRKRRATEQYTNGNLIIGTADKPIPCDVKITIKIKGDKWSSSYGAFPGSIPIGQKALGGMGGVQMHGCKLDKTFSTLLKTAENTKTIQLTDDVEVHGWKVDDEIAIATTDFEHRHTEYFTIKEIVGDTLTLNKALKWRHLGREETLQTIKGREVDQAAEVALLTRNIQIDGSDGAEGKVGGRIVIIDHSENIEGHDYIRQGFGQFSFVELKGMGQFGYNEFDDLRAQILFWGVNPTADEELGRKASYVKGCSFHAGFNTAVAAMHETHNLEIDNNVVFGCVDSAIRTDSNGLIVTNNLLGNIYQFQLWENYVETIVNTNFADDQMPAGIMSEETSDIIMTGNRVAGIDGSCYSGWGEVCDVSEINSDDVAASEWSGNMGHGCLRGYYNLRKGQGLCTRVSGFYFYKIAFYGVTMSHSTRNYIVDNTIILDAVMGFYANPNGPDPVKHRFTDKKMVIKNSHFSGRTAGYDCDYDETVKNELYAPRFCGRQAPPLHEKGQHSALLASDFIASSSGFPACAWHQHDTNSAMYGETIIFNTEFNGYNRKCGKVDTLLLSNTESWDHTFPTIFRRNNVLTDVNSKDIARYHRGAVKRVNIADCVDLFCDAVKKIMVVDEDGSIWGGTGATMLPESEYEWDDYTNEDGVTYEDTRDGLGNYRIPKPMETTLDGRRIPYSDVYDKPGIIRNDNCKWERETPGWNCPRTDDLQYHDLVFESMDADHERRRLTPLAIRAHGDSKYIDIVNGPGDHSCCIGYACQIRLMTMHTTIACGKSYDYFFSSTTPMTMRWHFPQAPSSCKVRISMYTKRPNRLDVSTINDGKATLIPATNAKITDGKMSWTKAGPEHMPSMSSPSGSNFHESRTQMLHMIFTGGKIFEVKVVETLILELGVMTELTNDEFYDNGNLACNLAALLGISKDKIRTMNVISENGSGRRRRRRALGFKTIRGRFARTAAAGTSIQFEISPESDNEAGTAALVQTGKDIVSKSGDIVAESARTMKEEMNDPNASVEPDVAMATPPKPPPQPEPPISLAAKLGVDEIQPGDDVEEFLNKIQETVGVPLSDLKTAEETANEAQAAKDAAMEPQVRKVPAKMVITEQPSGKQIVNTNFFENFIVRMEDNDGELMTTIGVEPWLVTMSMIDMKMRAVDSPTAPSMEGTTSTSFALGSGIALFDKLLVTGDLESCKFEFSVRSDEGEVTPVVSNTIEFLPAVPRGPCEEVEGSAFDKKESWSASCDFVCQAPCVDLSGLIATQPDCYAAAKCEDYKFAKCANTGCECDTTTKTPKDDYRSYLTTECSPTGMALRMPKCAMHYLSDMRLKDLSLNGVALGEDKKLGSSNENSCRGRVDYSNGPEYVFEMSGFDDCNTVRKSVGASATIYTNTVQGYPAAKQNIYVTFGCRCDGDECTPINPTLPEINECETGAHNCHADATCIDEANSSEKGFRCECAGGFEGDGVTACTDVDECADDPDICDTEVSTCLNIPGSFECQCKPGQDCSTGPCPSSKCWSFDAESFTCTLRDVCLELSCGSESIEMEFDVRVFGGREQYEGVEFNIGDGSGNIVPEIDSGLTKWTLVCPIGDCGMSYTSDDDDNLVFNIPITQTGDQRMRSDLKPHQVSLGETLKVNTAPHAADVTFSCTYPMAIDIESSAYEVTAVAVNGLRKGNGAFNFAMKLNDGGDYSENVLGTLLKVEVAWTLSTFSEATFYLSKCEVIQGDQSVQLVIDGCYASALSATPITQTDRNNTFKYRTFVMADEQDQYQRIKCRAKICVPDVHCNKVLENAHCEKTGDLKYYGYTLEGRV